MSAVTQAAAKFLQGSLSIGDHHRSAMALPARIKTGMAASLHNGRVHIVREAAIITDGAESRMAARWICGPGSANVRAAATDEVACEWCERLQHLPAGIAVYRCFGYDGELLYIGSTVNLPARIRQHSSTAKWWGDVLRIVAEPHNSVNAARYAESVAIAREAPLLNKLGQTLRVIDGGAA